MRCLKRNDLVQRRVRESRPLISLLFVAKSTDSRHNKLFYSVLGGLPGHAERVTQSCKCCDCMTLTTVRASFLTKWITIFHAASFLYILMSHIAVFSVRRYTAMLLKANCSSVFLSVTVVTHVRLNGSITVSK